MQELAIEPTTYIPVMAVGIAASMTPFASGIRSRRGRGDLPKFVVAAMLVAYARPHRLAAFGLVPASVASPIVNTQAIVAVVLGAIILDEAQFEQPADAGLVLGRSVLGRMKVRPTLVPWSSHPVRIARLKPCGRVLGVVDDDVAAAV